jgi:hypothetical protein
MYDSSKKEVFMLKGDIFFPAVWIAVLVLWALPALAEMIVDTAWVRRYNGPGNSDDLARAITIDGSGNVYVTGSSICSGTQFDYATIKYKPNGDTAWVGRYNGPENGLDYAYAIAVDASGNVYVTGSSCDSVIYGDFATIKYKPNGDTAWVRRYNGPGNDENDAYAIAVDGSGNVYVTGRSIGNGTSFDYATIKYYPNGDTAWVRRYNGSSNHDDVACATAVDDSGNVYVTGGSYDSISCDYATIKYKLNGDTAWVRRYNESGNLWDFALAIAVDGSGNVYVTGQSTGTGTGLDYATIKYKPNGDTTWVRRYNEPANAGDIVSAIAVDGSGNVYVTGSSYNGVNDDYATIKYKPNGDTAWVRRYNGPADAYDEPYAIAADDFGNVYVTGSSEGSGTSTDYATIKHKPNGDTAWVRRYNGLGNYQDQALALALDISKNVYVTGWSIGSGTQVDYATIKYVQTLRGDANGDWVINSADASYLINYLFVSGPAPQPWQAGDANCDGTVNSADVAYVINYLFIGGPPPDC